MIDDAPVAPRRTPMTPPSVHRRRWHGGTRPAGVLAGALACAAIVLASSGPASAASAATVGTGSNATFGTILTNAQGMALYTFPQDHGGMSACDTNAACVSVWPALTVPAGTTPTAGTGVSGTVAAVVQANGVDQVTYNGSPLYTFVGDTAPGQVAGNGVGGFAVVVVSSAPATPPTTAPTPPTTAPPVTMAPPSSMTTAPVSGSGPATAAAGSPGRGAPATPKASSPALAFTGPGPGLVWIAVAGAALVVPGAAALLWSAPGLRRRLGRRTPRRV